MTAETRQVQSRLAHRAGVRIDCNGSLGNLNVSSRRDLQLQHHRQHSLADSSPPFVAKRRSADPRPCSQLGGRSLAFCGRFVAADTASSLAPDVANTFTNGAFSKVTTSGPTTLYRVYAGSAKQLGAYWTKSVPTSSVAARLSASARALIAKRAGFTGSGEKIIVDENLPSSWAAALREAGYDARSVREIGIRGASDAQINQLASQVGGRVLTRDVGHDPGGGFGFNGVVNDSRVRSVDTVLRILGSGP